MLDLNELSIVNRQTTSPTPRVSDTRAGLKDHLRGKKTSEPIKSELEDYLTDGLDEASLDDEFDILTWWKLKAPKYPVLSRLTRDILAVPISTVAFESTFSTSGRTLNPVRNSLNDESIEALICAQDWLRASIIGTLT
jgi:hAT family C-terminal dimerisation region